MLKSVISTGNASFDLVVYLVVFALLLTVMICLIDFSLRPWGISRRISRTLRRWKICNALGEYPRIKRVRKSKQKAHELVLELDAQGLALPDFDKHLEHFKAGLNGAIRIDYGKRNNIVLLYFLPRKYVRTTIISPRDDAIGTVSIQHLINMLVVGPTGTGKSVATKIFMSKILKYRPDSTLWLLDFKQMDFQKFSSCSHYYGYTDCLQGLKDYYAAFKAQQATGVASAPNYLVTDEWGSLIMSLDKKDAEQAKRILAELLMLGRAYQFIPIIGIQRPDASYFQGSRDNFHACLALGNLSPEGRRMVFPDSVKEQITECKKREGHLYIDGVGLEKIQIEEISDLDALDKAILEAIGR